MILPKENDMYRNMLRHVASLLIANLICLGVGLSQQITVSFTETVTTAIGSLRVDELVSNSSSHFPPIEGAHPRKIFEQGSCIDFIAAAPPAPIALDASSISISSFVLNWTPVTGATGYYFDVATTSDFSAGSFVYENMKTSNCSGCSGNPNGSVVVYSNISLGNNTYYYRIRAENSDGVSTNSNTILVIQLPAVPVAPNVSDVSETGFTANWSASTVAEEYRLDISQSETFTTRLPGYDDELVTGTSLSVTGLSKGHVYYFRVRAKNSSGTSANSATVEVTTFKDYNYVKSIEIAKAGIFNDADITGASIGEKLVLVNYVDGLGRASQIVSQRASPQQKDIVEPIRYDGFGRRTTQYLPYVSNQSDGSYKNNALGTGGYTTSDQYFFYQNTPMVSSDSRPYSESVLESSPLNRVLKDYGPGLAWSSAENDRPVLYKYLVNKHGTGVSSTSEAVIAWNVDSGVPIRMAPVPGYIEEGGYYADGLISIMETIDEEGSRVREYTNKSGQLILKKVQTIKEVSDLNNLTHWAATYYLYDDFGNLVVVLPPEAVKALTK